MSKEEKPPTHDPDKTLLVGSDEDDDEKVKTHLQPPPTSSSSQKRRSVSPTVQKRIEELQNPKQIISPGDRDYFSKFGPDAAARASRLEEIRKENQRTMEKEKKKANAKSKGEDGTPHIPEKKTEDAETGDDELDIANHQSMATHRIVKQGIERLEVIMSSDNPDWEEASAVAESLEFDFHQFEEDQKLLLKLLLQRKRLMEYDQEVEYIPSVRKVKIAVQQKLQKKLAEVETMAGGGPRPPPHAYYHHRDKIKFDLPKFDGDVRSWLSWWAAFREFHNDPSYTTSQKFQGLIQCVATGTKAYKMVTSYPASDQYYEVVLDQLKDTFGNKKTLVKVYVRDLLKLVVDNAKEKPTLSFHDMVTSLHSQIRNLEILGIDLEDHGELLYPVVESCVPSRVLEAYYGIPGCKEELKDFLEYLNQEVRKKMHSSLAHTPFKDKESVGSVQSDKKSSGQTKDKGKAPATTTNFVNATTVTKCSFCRRGHFTHECRKAQKMSYEERIAALKEGGACFRCLNLGHSARGCQAEVKCDSCQGHHHVLTCRGGSKTQSTPPPQSSQVGNGTTPSPPQQRQVQLQQQPQQLAAPQTTTQMANYIEKPEVLLETLWITVYGRRSQKTVKAVYDGCSQGSYVEEALAREVDLTIIGKEVTTHLTFGGHHSSPQEHTVYKLTASPPGGNHSYSFNCSGMKQICGSIRSIPPGPWIDECRARGATFTDVSHDSSPVQVLIGADYEGSFKVGLPSFQLPSGLCAQQTLLGWVLKGRLPLPSNSEQRSSMMCLNMLNCSDDISHLWSLQSLGIRDEAVTQSEAELAAEAQRVFEETITRREDGRYEVFLPFVAGSTETLPSNYYGAEKRLRSMTEKLKKEGYFYQYDALFRQWEEVGMIEVVPEENVKEGGHYLPHRAVLKLSSTTTPIRPVFDASAKPRGKPSLNDCVEKGINYLELIPTLVTRFGMDEVGVTADIAKAFQQISVAPEHRDYLRFLWWADEDCTRMKVYRHTRVVFGVSSSPFLLAATLKYHLEHVEEEYRDIAATLLKSLYVDNLVVSVSSIEEANSFQQQSKMLLDPAHFDLRCWEIGPREDGVTVPVLGLIWDMKQDTLELNLEDVTKRVDGGTTQRSILSTIHMLFDPMGYVSPFVIVGMGILRKCHERKLQWDEEVPSEIMEEFQKFRKQLVELHRVKVPRINYFSVGEEKTLHVFCDASYSAYACVAFLRVAVGWVTHVTFIDAKAKLPPASKSKKKSEEKNPVSIPRLELLGCVIGAKLSKHVRQRFEDPSLPVIYWSDSTTALAWIKGEGPWAIFVSNRVKTIRDISRPEQWRHVPGIMNPADLPSRGCSAARLVELRWWEGPTWLYNDEDSWPSSIATPDEAEVAQEKKKTVSTNLTIRSNSVVDQLMTLGPYRRIVKGIAVWKRVISVLQYRVQRKKDPSLPLIPVPAELTEVEMSDAENFLLRYHQQSLLRDKNRLKNLRPFQDESGVLRTRSRLVETDEISIHPILLDDRNELTRRIIRQIHEENFHCGTQLLLARVFEKFWMPNGRRAVRKIVKSCYICKTFQTRRMEVPEPPLPKIRTSTGAPFSVTGVDMTGPLCLNNGKKVWIALFTCASFRAISLEIVDRMTTDDLFVAFRRFVARRNKPDIVVSDNGLNFVGASTALRKVYKDHCKKFAEEKEMQWRFNPPQAPWYGGWWERLIGLVKDLVKKQLGNRSVNRQQLELLLLEVEEVVNCRPLTYLSGDPNDPVPLTPNMFVKNTGLSFFPELDMRDAKSARKAYKKVQGLRESLRSRFVKEYLGQLKWDRAQRKFLEKLKPGDVVLIENDNAKRQFWKLAVVLEALPGVSDKTPRRFRLKTKTGVVERPAQRLFPMELHEEEQPPALEEE